MSDWINSIRSCVQLWFFSRQPKDSSPLEVMKLWCYIINRTCWRIRCERDMDMMTSEKVGWLLPRDELIMKSTEFRKMFSLRFEWWIWKPMVYSPPSHGHDMIQFRILRLTMKSRDAKKFLLALDSSIFFIHRSAGTWWTHFRWMIWGVVRGSIYWLIWGCFSKPQLNRVECRLQGINLEFPVKSAA